MEPNLKKDQFDYRQKHEVFMLDYWSVTQQINTSLEIGKMRKE